MMKKIEEERNKKLEEQLKNDIKLVKLQSEIRKNNERKLEEDLGIQKSLAEFHEPVLHQMEKLETSRQQHLQGIKDAVDDLSMTMNDFSFNKTLPQIEDQSEEDYIQDAKRTFLKVDIDKDMDETVLEEFNFELPSVMWNKTDKEIDEVIKSAKLERDAFKRQKANQTKNRNFAKEDTKQDEYQEKIDEANDKMNMMKSYIDALSAIKKGRYYTGKGLEDKMEILADLTDKICKGSKSKKLYNQTIHLLDALLREKILTNEDVKGYYKKFFNI